MSETSNHEFEVDPKERALMEYRAAAGQLKTIVDLQTSQSASSNPFDSPTIEKQRRDAESNLQQARARAIEMGISETELEPQNDSGT